MLCPKCQREQTSVTQCDYCGLLFEKYRQRLSEPEIGLMPASRRKTSVRTGLVWGAASVVIVLAGIIFFTTKVGEKGTPGKSNPGTGETVTRSGEKDIRGSIRNRLLATYAPKNGIESARNATVYIETGWKTSGSGFFIDDKCHIVTNAHVVKVDENDLREASNMRDEMKAVLETERQYLIQVRLRPEYENSQELRAEVAEREKRLEARTAKYEELNEMINKAASGSPSALKISLIDGSELQVRSVRLSDKYDLALLTVEGVDSPVIRRSDAGKLAQSQKLFTVGNPRGLKFSVTSGIFSGWQTINGVRVLQTDAPINPGNSGGPLLNENGEVLGVNTAILSNSVGIGFALPIDLVYSEFASSLK
jgi:S1-C subfamily serine protease